jgi:DNA-binding transcriptional LysR family regulator
MTSLRLSLDALQVLDAIARCGSLAAAGDELHRTASTLSYTVHKLEDDLGLKVFDRSGHRAVLTAAGRLLLEEGRALLDAAAAVERRVRTLGRGWEAEISLACNELVPLRALLGVVDDFYAAGHPTRVKLSSEVLGGAWEALLEQRADIAVAEVPASGVLEIAHRPIGSVSFQFCCAPDHPLARESQPLKIAVIRRHRAVVAADSARSTPARSSGIAAATDVLTVGSLRAKLEAQVAGLGVGFLPTALAADAVAAGQLVVRKVAAPKPRVAIAVAWRTVEAGHAAEWFVGRLQKIELT